MPDFESAYATLIGAKRCVATASGTTALITAMHVLGVDAGDEVITSPFTFMATYNTILDHILAAIRKIQAHSAALAKLA